MKTIGIFEAKTKLSDICAQVAATGEPVLVTRRGHPMVRIDPIPEHLPTIRERRDAYLAEYEVGDMKDAMDFELPARSKEPADFDLGIPGVALENWGH